MTLLMEGPKQLKIEVDAAFKKRVEDVFERQGTTLKIGVSRLLEFFLAQEPEVQTLLLDQLHGESKPDVVEMILARLKSQQEVGDPVHFDKDVGRSNPPPQSREADPSKRLKSRTR